MVIYDDMQTSEKVKVYDRGVSLNAEEPSYDQLVSYRHRRHARAGDFQPKEALVTESEEFARCIDDAAQRR